MPVPVLRTQYRAAVTCSVHKPAGFEADRIVGSIRVRSQRVISYVNSIGIYVEFRAGCSVLHIIPSVVFCQPRAFNIARNDRVAVVFTEPFPAVFCHIFVEEGIHDITYR